MTDRTGLGLDEAIVWVANNHLTGALEVSGDHAAGALYFDEGYACFGLVRGEPCVSVGSGIDPELWLHAISSPVSEIDFGAALIIAGATELQVRHFVEHSIERSIHRLRGNGPVHIRFIDRVSPFGTMFRHDVATWLDRVSLADLYLPELEDATPLSRTA